MGKIVPLGPPRRRSSWDALAIDPTREVLTVTGEYLPALAPIMAAYPKKPVIVQVASTGAGKSYTQRAYYEHQKTTGPWPDVSLRYIADGRFLVSQAAKGLRLADYSEEPKGPITEIALAITPDSSHRIAKSARSEQPLLIVDELSSVASTFSTRIAPVRARKCIEALYDLGHGAKKCIFADAFVTEDDLKAVELLTGASKDEILIIRMAPRTSYQTVRISEDDPHLVLDHVIQTATTTDPVTKEVHRPKLFVSCSTKARSIDLAAHLERKGYRVLLQHAGTPRVPAAEWINYDAVVASPAVVTGIDVNYEHFTHVILVEERWGGSLPSAAHALQRAGRIRRAEHLVVCYPQGSRTDVLRRGEEYTSDAALQEAYALEAAAYGFASRGGRYVIPVDPRERLLTSLVRHKEALRAQDPRGDLTEHYTRLGVAPTFLNVQNERIKAACSAWSAEHGGAKAPESIGETIRDMIDGLKTMWEAQATERRRAEEEAYVARIRATRVMDSDEAPREKERPREGNADLITVWDSLNSFGVYGMSRDVLLLNRHGQLSRQTEAFHLVRAYGRWDDKTLASLDEGPSLGLSSQTTGSAVVAHAISQILVGAFGRVFHNYLAYPSQANRDALTRIKYDEASLSTREGLGPLVRAMFCAPGGGDTPLRQALRAAGFDTTFATTIPFKPRGSEGALPPSERSVRGSAPIKIKIKKAPAKKTPKVETPKAKPPKAETPTTFYSALVRLVGRCLEYIGVGTTVHKWKDEARESHRAYRISVESVDRMMALAYRLAERTTPNAMTPLMIGRMLATMDLDDARFIPIPSPMEALEPDDAPVTRPTPADVVWRQARFVAVTPVPVADDYEPEPSDEPQSGGLGDPDADEEAC